MGGKPQVPTPPDYGPIMLAAQQTAARAQQLAEQQFEWAKTTYTQNRGVTDGIVERFLGQLSDDDRFSDDIDAIRGIYLDNQIHIQGQNAAAVQQGVSSGLGLSNEATQALTDALGGTASSVEALQALTEKYSEAQISAMSADERVANAQRALSERAVTAGDASLQRHQQVFQPLEDALVKEAGEYASPERIAQEQARAQADVAQQYEAARTNARQELESYGINPSATRYAALDIGTRTAQGAAQAAAADAATRATEQTGRDLRTQAIQVGMAYPGMAAQQYGTGFNAAGVGQGQTASLQQGGATANSGANQGINTTIGGGQFGAGNALGLQNWGQGGFGTAQGMNAQQMDWGNQIASILAGTTQSGANTMGTATQWTGAGNDALNIWGGTMNDQYNNQLDAWNAQNSASSGWGELAGTVLGAGLKIFGFEEGGAVPEAAAVTEGVIPDDVPARLTPGEFVVPEDTVRWFGEKHLHGLIEKAEKERAETTGRTGAIPAPMEPLPHPPTFNSGVRRQAAGAIPTG